MPIVDRHMGWRLARLYLPIRTFQGLDVQHASSASTASVDAVTLSQGNPTIEAVTNTEVVGLPMEANDEIHHVHAIPWKLDRDKPVRGRLYFQHAAADADTPSFAIKTKFFKKQESMVEIEGNADVTGTISSHACSTNNPSLEVTNWASLAWGSALTSTDIFFGVSVDMTSLGSASADECKLLGLELEYTIDALDTYQHDSAIEKASTV